MAETTQRFTLSYGGEQLAGGQIDILELTPVLIGIVGIIQRVNDLTNGTRAKARLSVGAATHPGGFPLDLTLAVEPLDGGRDLFTDDDFATAKTIFGTIFGSAGVLARLRNPPGPTADRKVGAALSQLAGDPEVRKHAGRIMGPLRRPGIDLLTVLDESRRSLLEISNRDYLAIAEELEAAPEETVERLGDDIHTMGLSLIKPSFERGLKWVVATGTDRLNIDLEDIAFQERMERNEIRFAAGDVLVVRMRTISELVNGKPRARHSLLRVLEHRRAPIQMTLSS